jgi:hypothetical protein
VPSRAYDRKELVQATSLAAKAVLARTADLETEMTPAGDNYDSYRTIIARMLNHTENSARLRDALMEEHRRYFKIGGANPGSNIDFDMPARIGAYLAINDLDYRELLTTKTCISRATWQPEPCDTFQPNPGAAQQHAAGVLSTRAFLSMHKNAAGFNFRLVKEAFEKFACAEYPDAPDPGTPREHVSNAVHPLGSNAACYSCHKSMNPKSYPFYFFKNDGFFSDQVGSTTRRDDNTPSNPGDVMVAGAVPMTLGQPVRNLSDLGRVYVQDRRFASCMTRRYVNFAFWKGYDSPLPKELEYLVDSFIDSGYRVKTLLTTILASPMFVEQGVLSGVP